MTERAGPEGAGPDGAAPEARTALIACGAIAQPAAAIVARHGWPVDVHPLPPLLHNQPRQIAGEVRALTASLRSSYARVVVGYADCGTYGALDDLCRELELERLPGLHCYDLYAGPSQVERLFADQPGTYLLTDFLVRSFARTVLQELGLDRHPDLRDTYFGHYTRVVWLAQQPDDDLRALAEQAADQIGLPLTVLDTGDSGLAQALGALVPAWPSRCPSGRPAGGRADPGARPRSPRPG